MKRVFEDLIQDNVVIAIAPTAYGKTAASPWMWERMKTEEMIWSLIHVAPLRSLLWRIYEDFFKPYNGRLQTHGAPEDFKSPYFLSSTGLIATTLDSFLWNLYRVPIVEAVKIHRGISMGHYYPTLMAIFTSLVIFDESHIYLWESPGSGISGIGFQAVLAAFSLLSQIGVPIVIETATLKSSAIRLLLRSVKNRNIKLEVLKAPSNSELCPYIKSLEQVGAIISVDKDWETEKLVKWKTEIIGSWDDARRRIIEDSKSGPILVFANTVQEALRLYKLLADVERIILVHGRLSEKDRINAEKKIKTIEKKGGIIVATQVAEAGLDVNSLAIYTSPAPLENLAQRAGRACRRGTILGECRTMGGKIMIIREGMKGPYPNNEVNNVLDLIHKTRERGKMIDWRATCNYSDEKGRRYLSYTSILNILDKLRVTSNNRLINTYYYLFKNYLANDAQPWVLLERLINGLCNLLRDSFMVEVLVEKSATVVALDWALRHANEVLEKGENGAPIAIMEYNNYVTEIELVSLWNSWKGFKYSRNVNCSILLKNFIADLKRTSPRHQGLASIKLKGLERAYRKGLGLLLNKERGIINELQLDSKGLF